MQSSQEDPFRLLAPQLSEVRISVLSLLDSGHPALSETVKYYFQHPSKQIRPLIVFLISRATNGLGRQWDRRLWEATHGGAGGSKEELDRPLTRPEFLNDWNPQMPTLTTNFTLELSSNFGTSNPHRPPVPDYQPTSTTTSGAEPTLYSTTYILPTQTRFAEIVEMIHTASLLHDDVIDASPLRRGLPSAPATFGSKLTILGGTFVLGRALTAASKFGIYTGTELGLWVIPSDLVEGELLQLDDPTSETKDNAEESSKSAWRVYLRKTYMKTASLIANCASGATILGGCEADGIWHEIADVYGRNLGMAFQLVDDILDYESAPAVLGKPSGADLEMGLVTCPALYAWEVYPEMGDLIQRKFSKQGDIELARDYVARSGALKRSRALAQSYADKAKEVIRKLPESEARKALETLTEVAMTRKN